MDGPLKTIPSSDKVPPRQRNRKTKKINLALQGGGAHGAFTWGALDRLVEEPVEIDGITATSAGAMNAAVFKRGWVENKADGVKQRLAEFWNMVGAMSVSSPSLIDQWIWAAGPAAPIVKKAIANNPFIPTAEDFTRLWSPYLSNPLNYNPLRALVEQQFCWKTIPDAVHGPQLFISATNVRTGKIKVFQKDEVTPDAILASACLPTVFQAIEIDDPKTGKTEAYWDGGFMGNPALYPLVYHASSLDILIVHINPLYREDVPKSASEIANRVNEISFNSSLLREMRNIDFVSRLVESGTVSPEQMKNMRIHSFADDETMTGLDVSTKLFADQQLLNRLHDKGYEAMDCYLRENWKNFGERSSTDLRTMFS